MLFRRRTSSCLPHFAVDKRLAFHAIPEKHIASQGIPFPPARQKKRTGKDGKNYYRDYSFTRGSSTGYKSAFNSCILLEPKPVLHAGIRILFLNLDLIGSFNQKTTHRIATETLCSVLGLTERPCVSCIAFAESESHWMDTRNSRNDHLCRCVWSVADDLDLSRPASPIPQYDSVRRVCFACRNARSLAVSRLRTFAANKQTEACDQRK